jgi:hypothetical protein
MAGYTALTKTEFESLEIPDLRWIALGIAEGITRGDGVSVDIPGVLNDFFAAFEAVANAARSGSPLPESFFVPDLWHVAKGKVASVPKSEGDALWDAYKLASNLGVTLYCEREGAVHNHNYPGYRFFEPRPKPEFATG